MSAYLPAGVTDADIDLVLGDDDCRCQQNPCVCDPEAEAAMASQVKHDQILDR